MSPPNADLVTALREIATLLRSRRADRFRVRAYERAARVAAAAPVPLAELPPERLRRLEGIGSGMAALIEEHARTGRIGLLDELLDGRPRAFATFATLPLIGVRDARRLADAGLSSLEALAAAVDEPARLDALAPRLAGRVRESLRRLPTALDPRRPRPSAERVVRLLLEALAALPPVAQVEIAGAFRRGESLVGDLDVVVVLAERADPDDLGEALDEARPIVGVLPDGVMAKAEQPEGAWRTLDVMTSSGHPARLWPATAGTFGVTLLAATGPVEHLTALRTRAAARGLELRADGLWAGERLQAAADESHIYRALGLEPIPPELRHRDVVEPAAEGRLPQLVRAGDLRGDLHVHSDFSGDGVDSLAEMVRGAAGRGYDYVAITDHAENLTINGMTREVVEHRRRTIAEVQRRHPHLRILDGAELNIGIDGGLDYDLEALLRFDLCVASIHSRMDADRATQTERVLAAIAHPAVHVIGHLTGRIIGVRPGYEIDLVAIAQAAAETGTALEVNGSPARLDLDAPLIEAALAAGATLSLSSDAHSLEELSYIENAVLPARAGGATAADVLNARDLEGLLAFTRRARERAS